jgi:hypothetical protein
VCWKREIKALALEFIKKHFAFCFCFAWDPVGNNFKVRFFIHSPSVMSKAKHTKGEFSLFLDFKALSFLLNFLANLGNFGQIWAISTLYLLISLLILINAWSRRFIVFVCRNFGQFPAKKRKIRVLKLQQKYLLKSFSNLSVWPSQAKRQCKVNRTTIMAKQVKIFIYMKRG